MENTGGMIAVVQGLRNSGLTVTLLDGGKQYTLVPEAAPHPKSPQLRNNPSDNTASRHQQCATDDCMGSNRRKNRQENGVQATDGRYASTYKMMHCNVSPTSPPQNVTEFPPQRSEVIPGHSNFVVGGYGSGEYVRQASKTNSFRGAMCWPDRGSVCVPKPSVQPDAFANSLRKYPSISPERSTEIVERLISFTQTKNMSRNQNRCTLPRNSTDSESSKETYLVETNSRNSNTKPSYYPDVTLSKKHRNDSPVRERSRDVLVGDTNDNWNRPFCRDNEVRCFTDASKNVNERCRPMNGISRTTKRSSSYFKEQYDNNFDQRRILDNTSNNSVNIEIQAAAQMESKEILTLPRIVPMQRTIATAISPVSSNTETKILTENSALKCRNEFDEKYQRMSMPTNITVKNDNIETNSRDIESRENRFIKSQRSRSKEVVVKKNDFKDEIMRLLKNLKAHSKYDVDIKDETEPLLKKMKRCVDRKPLFTVYENLRRSVSDNMFYYNDNQFTISQPDTSDHTSDTLRGCLSVKTYDLCEKNPANKNKVLENDMKRPRCLSSSTNTYNSGFIDVSDNNCKEKNKILVNNNTARKIFGNSKKYHKIRISSSPSDDNNRYKNFFTSVESNKEPAVRNRKELRNSIDLGILAFTEKYRMHITTESLYKLREELLDILLMNIKSTSHFNALNIRSQVRNVLKNNGFNECYAARLANILTEHWDEEFSTNNYTELRCSNIMSDTFIVLPSINIDSSGYQGSNSVPDYSINQISQKDIDANVNLYMNQVLIEINQWLSDLRLSQAQDEELRQTLLTNLATDIVDRQKYLELNPSSEASDASELEYLKYQIFKWMYKLIGDNNMTPVERASELMERIRTIPVPVFYIQQKKLTSGGQSNQESATGPLSHNINVIEPSNFGASSTKRLSTPAKVCCNRPTCKRNVNKVSPDVRNVRDIAIEQQTTSTRRMSSPGNLYSNIGNRKGRDLPSIVPRKSKATENTVNDSNKLFSGGIKIKDDEKENTDNFPENKTNVETSENRLLDRDTIKNDYIKYLNDWVQELPIVVSNVQEENLANVARTEIFDKIYEIATKLRSNHKKGSNRFLYEDMLDEEIEKLLSNIPQSQELESKKHLIKVKLIEKTIDFLELSTPLEKSYKEQLIQQVKEELPCLIEGESRHSELLQLYEELQILNLVEEFIMCSRYQNVDKVMSEAYRNKLVKHAKLFVKELKENHGKALMNIEANLYVKNILDTLQKVPLPSDETIKEEADEILLGLEIEKWFLQLPLVQNDDLIEQLHRKRLRNHLAKEIHNIENGSENPDSTLDNTIRHEVSLFLERAPLQVEESLNINTMVEDLIKRLKTRPKILENDTKKVGFHETDYRDFSENLPFSSSFAENPREPDSENTGPKRNLMDNKSIQAVPTRDSTFGGFYNIAKPLLDDIKFESKCCETDTSQKESPEYKTLYDDRPIRLQDSDNEEPQWYTLRENSQEHPQTHISRNTVLHPHDRPHYINNRQYPNYGSRYYNPEQFGDEFIVPQQYFKREAYQPYKSKIFNDRSPLTSPMQNQGRLSNQKENSNLPSSYVPTRVSPRRRDTLKFSQDPMRSDIFNPQRLPFPYRTQGETERNDNISMPPPGLQDTVEESRSPQMKPSDLFNRSTDQEGIRLTIDRNRSIEANPQDRSVSPEHLHYYSPYMTMPPGYIPVRKGKKAFIGENFPEDSEEDIDEDEIHCKCVEKMWKSRRRPKHCPLENIDGYPPCISPPYYYPYFY